MELLDSILYNFIGDFMNRKIDITKDDLIKMVYFIISKFEFDVFHMQGTSSKADLLGGFIDRWINRIPEVLIFNKLLLKDKDYKVINDYFVYGNDSDKNAPDVLGLKTEDGKIVKFAEFEDTTWKQIRNMPWLEVKTFRKNQKMFTIRETQMEDEHYYVMTESDISPNYLKILFQDIIFDNKFYDNIIMDESFVNSNDKESLQQPKKVEKFDSDIIGTIQLLGIYKGKDIKKIANLCPAGVKPYYFNGVEEIEKARGVDFDSITLKEDDENYGEVEWSIEKDVLEIKNTINVYGNNLDNIVVAKKNKSSWYVTLLDDCNINGIELKKKKRYKIKFTKFDRSSNWNEYITLKKTLDNEDNDRTNELVLEFDKIRGNI